MHRNLLRKDDLLFRDTGSAIADVVRIEHNLVILLLRYTKTVAVAFNRSEVADGNDIVALVVGAPEDDHILDVIIVYQPLEAVPAVVDFPHSGIFQIKMV